MMPSRDRKPPQRRPFALSPLLVGLAAAWAVSPAQAQQAPEAQTSQLPPVTVTAERREENIKDVPVSVSTLSGENLDVINSSGQDIRMLAGRVPSLNIESSFGRSFPRFYIRGYGNSDFHTNASQPVSLIYDDIVQENPILKGFPLFDVTRVELLAGPQGTLFGRNTPAGVVKIDSVKPSRQADAYLNLSYGSFGTANAEGASNLPLSGDWTARASAQVQHRDNWVTNTHAAGPTHRLEGYDDRAMRLQAAYDGGGVFSALFSVHDRDLQGSARLFRANIIKPGTNDLVDGFDPAKISTDGANAQTLQNGGGSIKLKWSLPEVNVHAITGYETVSLFSRGDVDGGYGAAFLPTGGGPGFIPFPVEGASTIRGHHQLTQELRVESKGDGPLAWQAGAYYFNEAVGLDALSYNSLAPGNPQIGATLKTGQKNDAWALFGSVNYALSPALSVRAGLRYTHDRKSLVTQPLPPGDPSPTDTANGLASRTNDARFSGDLSGSYKLDKDTNLFARLANGFRGSSIQAAGQFAPLTQAGPETATSFEVGLKSDLWDKRGRTSISLFRFDVRDQQLTAVGGSSNAVRLLNAAKTLGQGVEANLEAYLTPRLLITFSGSYNHTEIRDPSLAVAVCAACTVLNPKNAAGLALINGNPLPNAPEWIATLTARYAIPAAGGGEYFVHTDWSYRSEVNFFLYRSAEFTGKSLLEGGLRVGYTWDNGKYEVAAFGRNITNQIRITGGIDFNNLTGFINDPRTVGVQLKVQL
jgi:iron complex outermembrane receptor protein